MSENETTRKISPIAADIAPDLSEDATRRRLREESAGSAPPPVPTSADPVPTPPAVDQDASKGNDKTADDSDAVEAPDAAEDDEGTDKGQRTEDGEKAKSDKTEDTAAAAAVTAPPAADSRTPATAAPRAVGSDRAATQKRERAAANRLRKRRMAMMRAVVLLVTVLALASTGTAWGYLKITNSNLNNVDALDANSPDIVDAEGQTGDETYLIVGTDTRAGQNGEIGAGTVSDAEGARSDTVILVNIPADRSRIVAVSFPRDLNVDRPSCDRWQNDTGTYTDEEVPAEDNAKLNSAYGLGGPKCLVRVLQRMTGLQINHFIGMDFSGFQRLVDEVGGVEVCSTTPLYDYELGPILELPGRQMINGQRALNYVRARMIESEGNGDYGRIHRQQLFMSSLLRAALSNRVLFDPGRLNGFIGAFTDEAFVTGVDTQQLLNLGKSLQEIDAGHITFVTTPTDGTNELGNEIPREDDIEAVFTAIIDDRPLPGEEAAPASTESGAPAPEPAAPAPVQILAAAPWETSVRVLNGTGTVGIAQEVATQLENYGFGFNGVADASEAAQRTVVRYGQDAQTMAAAVAAAVPGALIQFDAGVGEGLVQLILGRERPTELDYPVDPGTPVEVTELAPVDPASALPNDLAITNAGVASCE